MTKSPAALQGISTMVAMPCMRDLPLPTVMSLLRTQEECIKHGIEIDICFFTGSLVHHARTLAANVFLNKEHNRLFFIDSDMDWTPTNFIQAVWRSTQYDCVAGIYPRRADPLAFHIRLIDGLEPDENGMVEIEGTGLGFSCIQRKVIEHLAALSPKLTFGSNLTPVPSIFRCDDDGTQARGEDYAFWADVRENGYKVWADTGITLGHVGQKIYRLEGEMKDGTSSGQNNE